MYGNHLELVRGISSAIRNGFAVNLLCKSIYSEDVLCDVFYIRLLMFDLDFECGSQKAEQPGEIEAPGLGR